MQNNRHLPAAVLALSAAGLLIAAPMAYGYYASDAVTVQQQGNIQFVSGGIGDEDRAAMQTVQRNYNLHIMSSGKDGAFTDNNLFSIYDKFGNEVLSTQAGPLFYAALPAGKYTVVSQSEGATQKKTAKVTQGGATELHFIW